MSGPVVDLLLDPLPPLPPPKDEQYLYRASSTTTTAAIIPSNSRAAPTSSTHPSFPTSLAPAVLPVQPTSTTITTTTTTTTTTSSSSPSSSPSLAISHPSSSSPSTPPTKPPRRPISRPRLQYRTARFQQHPMGKKPVLTESEYEALPPSIQRKYFSSVERLRIAEHAARQQAKTRPLARFPGPIIVSNTSPTIPLDGRARAWTQVTKPGNPRSGKSHSLRRNCNISHAEAQWFLSLPEKVRRQHFTREEQVLLAGGLDIHLLDSADHPVNDKKRPTSSQLNRNYDPDSDCHFLSESRGRPRQRSSSPSLRRHFHPNTARNDSSLIDRRSPTPEALPQRPRRSRTMSATNIPFSPFRHSTSSSTPSAPSSFASRRPLLRQRAQSNAVGTFFDAPRSSIEAPAKHYQDPDARQKLKAYLGSPQKFDEAIEFGFPSAQQENTQPKKPHTAISTRAANHDVQSFLRDETLSCMESNAGELSDVASHLDYEEDTDGDMDSPVTPSDFSPAGAFRTEPRSSSNFSSLDSNGLPAAWPNLKQLPQDPYQALLTGNREMTLRMTLTRPDLRAKDEELYGWQSGGQKPNEKDPLALEELPAFTDDVTGSHCPFPANNRRRSLVGRLLGKMKKKA